MIIITKSKFSSKKPILFSFWWQYLISMFIFLLGFTFLLAVESEKVEIHKEVCEKYNQNYDKIK